MKGCDLSAPPGTRPHVIVGRVSKGGFPGKITNRARRDPSFGPNQSRGVPQHPNIDYAPIVINRRGRVVMLAGAVALVVVLPASNAGADSTGSEMRTMTNNHFGGWDWVASVDAIKMQVYAANGLNSDRCADAWFDWSASGHYDARVVRTCKPGSNRYTNAGGPGFYYEPSTSRNLSGEQKVFLCLYNQSSGNVISENAEIVAGGVTGFESVDPNYSQNSPNPVTRAWHRQADGDTYISDGHEPESYSA